MNPAALAMVVLPHRLSLCQLPSTEASLTWSTRAEFCSIMRTPTELSVICDEGVVPADVKVDSPWRAIEILGPLPPELTGVIAAFSRTLAEAQISIAVISSSTTEYILVQDANLAKAVEALRAAGHSISHRD